MAENAGKQKDLASMTVAELEEHIRTTPPEEETSELPPSTPEVVPEPEKTPELAKEPDAVEQLMVKKGLDPNSPEDRVKFADIYANAERKISQDGERFKKMRGALETVYALDEEGNVVGYKNPPPSPTPPPVPQQGEQSLDKLQEMYDSNPLKTNITLTNLLINRAIHRAVSPLIEDKIDRDIEKQKKVFSKTKKDFDEMEESIDSIVNSIPLNQRLTPQGKVKAKLVEDAYYFVKGRKADEIKVQSEEAAALRTQQSETEKKKAFMEKGGKPPVTLKPDINTMTAAQLEKFIQENPNYEG